jgi:hypothetical protein
MSLDDKCDALGIGQRVPGPMGSVGGVARTAPVPIEQRPAAYGKAVAKHVATYGPAGIMAFMDSMGTELHRLRPEIQMAVAGEKGPKP